MEINIFDGCEAFQNNLKSEPSKKITFHVREILESVEKFGDSALEKFTKKYDKILPNSWLVPKSAIEEALKNLDPKFLLILESSIAKGDIFDVIK